MGKILVFNLFASLKSLIPENRVIKEFLETQMAGSCQRKLT